MSNYKIVMHDGTEFLNSTIGFADGIIWCNIFGSDMLSVIEAFSDINKTSHLIFIYGEMQDEYDGYVFIRAILKDYDSIKVALTREE